MDLKMLRAEAETRFREKGFPTTREELWRFTDVSPVAERDFNGGWKPTNIGFDPVGSIRLVFENGRYAPEQSIAAGLPDGVRIGSILDCADPRIGHLADCRHAFVAANTAYFSDGIFIDIAEDVELAEPIHLVFLADAPGAAFHLRNLVSAGVRSKVTLIEEYIGAAGAMESPYWTNAVTEVFAADGASVDHYKIQRENSEAFHFQTVAAEVGAGALFSNHAVTIGSALGRNDIRGKLAGEGGESICNGLYLLRNRQLFDTHMFMDHAVPRCNSHELYKGILSDRARAVFCGRILVRQDAQQTDAIQSNRNLLLSRDAKVNTLPQLEIYADDVKCTHGATVGQLDEQALFYLQSRGIDSDQANAMLTFAFANEVLDEVKCTPVKTYIEKLVEVWLDGVSP